MIIDCVPEPKGEGDEDVHIQGDIQRFSESLVFKLLLTFRAYQIKHCRLL